MSKSNKPKPPPPVSVWTPEAKDLFLAMNRGAPVACALIGGAFIEKAMATLLHAFLIEGDTSNSLLGFLGGPLGSLQPRADIAYSLGLIDKPMYQNISHVGSIRNKFAHSHVNLTFEHPEVLEYCNKLKPPEIDGIPASGMVIVSSRAPMPEAQKTFCATVLFLTLKLHDVTVSIKRCESPEVIWVLPTTLPLPEDWII